MNENDLISIIVPVYNVEKYLNKCVESLLGQSYKNIEILLVDDGSKDLSPSICDEYAQKYKEIICAFHKKNGGLADARNYGIKKAKGKYICFVDSDDFVNYKMIENLYTALKENNAQIAVCNFFDVYENKIDKNYEKLDEKIKDIKVYETSEALIAITNLNLKFAPNVCNKLFSRELFSDDCFFPVGKLYEDMIVTVKTVSKAKKIVYIDCNLYYYLQRSNSITSAFNLREFDHIEMSLNVLDYIKSNFKNVKNSYICYHIVNSISVINKMILNDSIDLELYYKIREYIKKNKHIVYREKSLSKKKKFQIILFSKSLKLYSKLYKKHGGI